MKFCVDELGFDLTGHPSVDLSEELAHFLALVQTCRSLGVGDIERSASLDFTVTIPNKTLADIIYANDLDRDLRLAVQEAINRCVVWDSDPGPSSEGSTALTIDGISTHGLSQARAFELAGRADAVGLLVLMSSARIGRKQAQRTELQRPLYFVADTDDLRAFLREVPELEDMDSENYFHHAPIAFRQIHFTEGLADQAGRFSSAFKAVRITITRHLAALNDVFVDILKSHGGDTRRTATELRARCGVEASPESGNTKHNAAAWRARRIVVGEMELWCNWHTKLEPHRDRIYFHPGQAGLVDGRLIVGILHEHLPL